MPPEEPQTATDASSTGELRPAPESLLGVDVGSAFTKVALFEAVEGQYRLLARAQARTDTSTHIYETVSQACQHIEGLTGRRIFHAGEPVVGEVSGGHGVEVLGASLTCNPPLRVLATNAEAAAAARTDRCQVELLQPGSLASKVERLAGTTWDAVAGQTAEVQEALQCLGRSEPEAGLEAPATIEGSGETIRNSLAELSIRLAMPHIPGLAELKAVATEPLSTGPAALLELTRLIAARFGLRLGVADCGASHTTICRATSTESSARVVIHDQPITDLPVSAEHMSVLHKALQDALSACVEDGFSADLLVATGALAHFGRWSEPALTLLNGVRPAGVIQFGLDAASIVGPLAALAGSYPDIVCQIFEQDGLLALGAAICPRGATKPGVKAIEVRWQVNDEAEQIREVSYGQLVRLPVPPGRKANLTLYPAKQVDVGLNRPGVAATAHVDGGRVGLMVDARHPEDKTQRGIWQQALE